MMMRGPAPAGPDAFVETLSGWRRDRVSMIREDSLAIIEADVGTAIDPDCFEALRSVV